MFGVSVKEMVGRDLAEFIPRGCPSNNAEDLLIVGGASTKKGGLGAKKKTVGKLMPLDAKHADGSTIAIIGQAAKHPDKPRVLLRLRLFRPTSPTQRTSNMAASMSREAKLLQNVLPVEQTPTGVPANPGRPLIDFATELPPPAALAAPAGGYGGPGSKQPQSIKQALEASDQMFAAKEREGNKLLTPRTSRSTRDEAAAAVFPDTSKASLGAPVSGQGEQAASVVKRAYSTASALLQIQRHGAASPAMDVQALAEAMPPSATAYEGIAPPVKTIAEDTSYAVPATMSAGASEQLDLELGSHHGSQQGSAAASSFEGQELDEDEAAAAADFTPMTEEKRLFVNEWIAKLGEGLPDEQDPVEDTGLEQEANDAAARVAGVGGDREDRGLLAAAAQDDEGEGGAVYVLDSASAAGDAPEGGDVSSGADFARAKRHKKLSARLNSSAARSRMTWLKRHSVYVLLFLLVTHTGGFIATRLLLGDLKAHVASVTATGVITSGVLRLATLAREAQISGSLYAGNGTSTPVRIRSQAACATTMLSRIAVLTTHQRQLYLEIGESSGDVKNRLESLYNTASLNITVYQETTPPRRVYRQIGLWDAGNSFIAAARGVSDLPIIYRYNFTQMAQWNFIIDNAATLATAYTASLDLQTAAAQDSSNLLLLVDIILLVVEGAFVIPLALAYMSWVRRACAVDRASLYSIFLRVPRPTVVAIAKAEVKLVGEDADDDDDPPANADQKEEEEGKWAATKGMQYSARGRSLTYSRKAIVVFIMPLIAWLALIILSYGLSYMFVNNSQPRLDSVNGGSRVQSSTFGMRFFANEMVYASTPISLAGARQGLNSTSNILRTWHERLLFGSSTEEVAAGSIQYQTHGALPAYRSTPRVQQVYFSDGCLRAPASTCLNSSNPYYPMTNHGLNVLTYYFMDQADNLANEMEEDVLNSNPHYAFIQAVALNDFEVAQTAVQAELESYTIQPTASEQIMQIVVFVVMFVGAGIYFMWYVKPFLSQYAQERKRAAMMLSQLPADIDIAMLLQPEVPTASGATPQKAKKGNAVSPSSGFKSVRVD